MRRIFFPLKSGVELFEDPSSPEAVTRAKEAAVLYDEVIFEDGLYDIAITPQGSTNFWTPPSEMTPERLEHSRRGRRVGEPMTLAIGKQRAVGQPAEQMSVVLQGTISASYVSEYYTGVIQELAKFEPPWARKVTIGGSDNARELGQAAYAAIKELNYSDLGNRNLMPDTDSFLKTFIYQSFNRDSVLAAGMEASFSVTPMFAPMVSHRGLRPELAGSEALSVLVPDLTRVPWEAVVEYREHPGSSEIICANSSGLRRRRNRRTPTSSSARSARRLTRHIERQWWT